MSNIAVSNVPPLPAPTSVVRALAEVMRDVQGVAKRDRNESQGFSFRGIDAVVNAVGPALRKHGVVVVPEVRAYDYGSVEVGRNRTPMGHVKVTVAYHFYGPEGDRISAVSVGEAMDSGDKATAKAMSVAFRTALLQALCLPTDEPDPDTTSYERSHPEPELEAELFNVTRERMRVAETLDALHSAGTVISAMNMSPAQRAELRDAYVVRKQELDASEPVEQP
jgi:hypothetical protein